MAEERIFGLSPKMAKLAGLGLVAAIAFGIDTGMQALDKEVKSIRPVGTVRAPTADRAKSQSLEKIDLLVARADEAGRLADPQREDLERVFDVNQYFAQIPDPEPERRRRAPPPPRIDKPRLVEEFITLNSVTSNGAIIEGRFVQVGETAFEGVLGPQSTPVRATLVRVSSVQGAELNVEGAAVRLPVSN